MNSKMKLNILAMISGHLISVDVSMKQLHVELNCMNSGHWRVICCDIPNGYCGKNILLQNRPGKLTFFYLILFNNTTMFVKQTEGIRPADDPILMSVNTVSNSQTNYQSSLNGGQHKPQT